MAEIQKARLENWYVGNRWGYPVEPTDSMVAGHILYGEVYGHPNPNLADGTFVHTSYIVDSCIKENWVQTKNTFYLLGTPKKFEAPVECDM